MYLLAFAWLAAAAAASPKAAPAKPEPPAMAAFAFGRGGAAAVNSVNVQHSLRELLRASSALKPVDIEAVLDAGVPNDRQAAIEDGQRLFEEGKAAYDQLDLEQAQGKFDQALKKIEYGLGYLGKQVNLTEALMYLGATAVLSGEPEKASDYFLRACDLPGRKTLDPGLFPPNIQEALAHTEEAGKSAPRGGVSLTTEPLGAEIFIDLEFRGGAPLKLEELRAASHLVVAQKDGFRQWGGKIQVDAGKMRTFKVALKPTQRHNDFSAKFQAMATEAFKKKPGAATAALGSFLGVQRVAAIAMDGDRGAMTLRGYVVESANPLAVVTVETTLDLTKSDYEARLQKYLTDVLAATLKAPEPEATGTTAASAGKGAKGGNADQEAEEVAKKLLAQNEKEQGEEEGLGLDLSEGAKGSESELKGEHEEVAKAEGETTGDKEEKAEREKALQQTIRETKKDKETAPGVSPSFSWTYLHDKWWFWTAIGVVTAGVVTGIAIAAAPGGPTGSLTLELH